jgi:hypothetical protein
VEQQVTRQLDARYQRKPKASSRGYERGSLMARMTAEERKRFVEWKKSKDRDARVYERQLEG